MLSGRCQVQLWGHDISWPYGRAVEQTALYEANLIRHTMAGGVASGDGERLGRNVRRNDERAGKLLGQSDGDAARAGAAVDDAQTIAVERSLVPSAEFADSKAV